MLIAMTEPAELLFERAFARHWEDVFRFVLAFTNDWGIAEDLTQESFSRLWQSRLTIDWERPMLPWLFVVSRRLAADRFRLLRRRIAGGHSSSGPDEAVRARWLDVRLAMGRLSPHERAALVLTTIQGFSYDEAAAALDAAAGAVRAAVSRAQAKLEVD
jgi:RNA polymerase sigma-70 factor (ECF subfamily)